MALRTESIALRWASLEAGGELVLVGGSQACVWGGAGGLSQMRSKSGKDAGDTSLDQGTRRFWLQPGSMAENPARKALLGQEGVHIRLHGTVQL